MDQNMRNRVAAAKKSKKHLHQSGKTYYFCFAMVLLLFCLFIWLGVWNKLEYFESKSSQTLLNRITEEISSSNEGEVTYKKVAASEPGQLSYDFFIDGNPYMNVNLDPLEERGFLGMNMYEEGKRHGNVSSRFTAVLGDSLTVDGSPLQNYKPDTESVLPGLDRLSRYEKLDIELPEIGFFELEELYRNPDFAGENLVCIETENGIFYTHSMPEDMLSSIKPDLIDMTKNYSLFLTNDQSFWMCDRYMWRNTPIHKQLRQMYVSDYTPHSAVNFGDEFVFSDALLYSNDFASVRVSYEYTVVGQYMTMNYNPVIKYYLYSDKGSWKVIEMELSE